MLFIVNKYQQWYYSIINSAKARALDKSVYSENHHIIPRSLGGEDSKENLVKLTAREHFICHILLTKFTSGEGRKKMLNAVLMMKRGNLKQLRYMNSRLYETVRIECNIIMSETTKGRFWWNNGKIIKQSFECPGAGWTRGKMPCPTLKDRLWWNNGKIVKRAFECPGEGFIRGRLPNPVISIKRKGKQWWNNGEINNITHECPGERWLKGKTPCEALSIANTGKSWWNNGEINKFQLECPGDNWIRGRSGLSNGHNKGKSYWNNGKINKMAVECPGEGWIIGRK